MNDTKTSWRSISQHLGGPAITPIAQKRRSSVLLKRVLSISFFMLLVLGLGGTAYYLSVHSKTFAPYAEAQEKTKIAFFSDGQLTENWFNDTYASIKQKGLLSIDISELQNSLLRNPQVLQATVERHFPGTLRVTLRERQPLARLQLRMNGKIQLYYVARDGQFFSSSQLKPPAALPYLAGLTLRPVGGQLPPLPGAAPLAEVLDGLKERFPQLYVQLRQIDLKNWIFPVAQQTTVSLSTGSGTQLRFGPTNIALQLDRLQETLNMLATEKQELNKKIIDLTYTDRVAISNINNIN